MSPEEQAPLTREVRLGQWHEDAGKWTWKPGAWKGTLIIEKIAFEEGSDEKYWMSIGSAQCSGETFRKVILYSGILISYCLTPFASQSIYSEAARLITEAADLIDECTDWLLEMMKSDALDGLEGEAEFLVFLRREWDSYVQDSARREAREERRKGTYLAQAGGDPAGEQKSFQRTLDEVTVVLSALFDDRNPC